MASLPKPLQRVAGSTVVLSATWVTLRVYAFLAGYDRLRYPHYPRAAWINSDVVLFASWAPKLGHFQFPTGDPRWQYPPGAGILLSIPQWMSAAFGFSYSQAFQVLIALADLALLVVLIYAGRKWAAPFNGLAGAWFWALAPLFVGPIMAARFDTVVALTAVGGIVLLYAKRPTWAGAILGVGLMIKAWPALMLAAAQRRDLARGVIGLIIGVACVAAVGLFWDHSWSFINNEVHRGIQIESVAALPWVLRWWTGVVPHYQYQFGALEIISPYTHTVGIVCTLVGGALLLVLAALRLLGRLDHVAGVDVAYAALLVSVTTSRVYSPQYNLWLVAIGAAVLLDRRTRLRSVLWWIVGASIAGQIVYPIVYDALLQGYGQGIAPQVVRIVCLVVATTIAYVKVVRAGFKPETQTSDLDQLQQVAA